MKKLSKILCIVLSLLMILPMFTAEMFADLEDTSVIVGDVDGNGKLDNADAIHLLYHTIFGNEMYPVSQPCDFDANGTVNNADAIYLLYHALFPEAYPIPPKEPFVPDVEPEEPIEDAWREVENYLDVSSLSGVSGEQKIISIDPVALGETVVVHVIGTSDANFRMWLSRGDWDRASQIHYIDDYKTFDLVLEITADGDYDNKGLTEATHLQFKGPSGGSLNNLNITYCGIFYGTLDEYDKEIASLGKEDPDTSELDKPLTDGTMRRPLSNESPMLIVHIDSWNYPDPQKIIDLIPEDILPFCVFNISLSVGHDAETGEYQRTGTPYELCKSWIRTCAENNVYCMVQPSSGGWSNFPDYGLSTDYEETLYAEFFRDYPNFIGFNYCEQFWGYDQVEGIFTSPTVEERYNHLSKLLELADKYGGYVVVSWCGNQWGQWLNPAAILKTHPTFKNAVTNYSDHFILCDKYTQSSYKHDVQSQVLGFYLSGYCGNFGVRYDETAWSDEVDGEYTMSTGLSTMLESMLLSGATVIDGPELIWADDFYEGGKTQTSDGYTQRNWYTYTQYRNVLLDMMRKVLDGSLYIPTREEVMDRVKVAIIQDVKYGNDDQKYCTPETLFEGLYRMSNDGNLRVNYYHYKTNGRYPTIPLIVDFRDPSDSSKIENQIKASQYSSKFGSISSKVNYFNNLFPQEYTGDLYAGRFKNTWFTYSYYLKGEVANATLDLQYNTCDTLGLRYDNYSSGIITEYSDHIDLYLNNYDDNNHSLLRTDVITIKGATEKPTYTYRDRGDQVASTVKESWANGVYTLTVSHNGPVEITVNCKGSATGRSTDFATPKIVTPSFSTNYHGDRQYEGECFDYKGANVTSNGYKSGIKNYTGQGFINLGKNSASSVKDTVTVLTRGTYNIVVRYAATSDCNDCTLTVNGKEYDIDFSKTSGTSDWKTVTVPVTLRKGKNEVKITVNNWHSSDLYIDNMVVSKVE